MRSEPLRWKARAISRLPIGVGLSRMKARTCSLVGKGAAFLPCAFRSGSARCALPRRALLSGGFEIDFDKGVLEVVGVDDVVLDPGGPVIGAAGLHFGNMGLLAVIDRQLAVQERHHYVIMPVTVPTGLGPGCKTPLGDDDPIVLDLLGWGGL